jgi:hydrophobic/amphiphilic exporter-1 (mainly G- bacteria), HAE1 family
MSALVRLSLRYKTVTLLLVVLLLGAGVFSVMALNQELFPSMDIPAVVVTAVQPGAGPAEVAEGLARPIEEAFRGTSGIRHVSSTSLESLVIVTAEYEYGTDMPAAEQQVRGHLDAITFPTGVAAPTVARFSVDSIPIIAMAVFGDDAAATESYVDDQLLPALEATTGVGAVSTSGGSHQVVAVMVDPAALAEAGLSPSLVAQALAAANLSVPVGGVAIDGTQFPVRVSSTPDTLDEIKAVPVGGGLTLGEIALVTLADANSGTTISRTDGRPSIGLEIIKEQGANTLNIDDAIKQVLAENPPPEGVSIAEVVNQAPRIRTSVSELARDAVIGGLLAVAMILLFLRSVRSTLVAGVSIPLSLLVAFILMNISDISLNILTLGALSVAAGRVIDDAIVVIENTHRLMESGLPRREAVIQGTSQVIRPVTGSTITTVAVFLPMALVGGLVGEVFVGFALTVSFALLASLLVAITVVPVLADTFLKPRHHRVVDHAKESRLRAFYRPSLAWALRHRAITLLGAVALLAASIFSLTAVPTNLFPGVEATALDVSLTAAPGTTLDSMSEQVAAIEDVVSGMPGVTEVMTVIGTSSTSLAALMGTGSGTNSAQLTVGLTADADTDTLTNIIEGLIQQAGLAGAVSAGSGYGSSQVSVEVTGDDFAAVAAAATEIGAGVAEIEGLKNVTTNVAGDRPQLAVVVDPAAAAAHGLNPTLVAAAVRAAMTPTAATTVTIDGAPRQVLVMVNPAAVAGIEALAALPVAAGVTLGEVATISEASTPTAVTFYDGSRSAEITGTIASENMGKVISDTQAVLDGYVLPDGVEATMGGAAAMMSESFSSLAVSMLIAVCLVYLAMVTTFGSLLTPFVILLTLPLAAIGAFPALLMTGRELGLTAMLGLLMLIGIVVTNAIVMLDFVERLRQQGMGVHEALLEGAQTRLRPILMTAGVTILALVPLALGFSQGALLSTSLATVVIGGLFSSTLLTLLVIPVVYSLFDGLRRRLTRHPRVQPAPAEG